MNNVPLATFNESEAARPLHERLQKAGIPAFIHDESRLQRFWFMSVPLAAIHVQVPQSRYLEARQRVEEWDHTDGILREAVRCPDCYSSRVEFPQLTRKFVTPGLGTLLFLLRIIPREFYCFDCHHTWPLAEPVAPELDILGWPVTSRLWHPEKKRAS